MTIALNALEEFHAQVEAKNDNPIINIGKGQVERQAIKLLCHCHVARATDASPPQLIFYSNLARTAITIDYGQVYFLISTVD